jgi:hypothetical protein
MLTKANICFHSLKHYLPAVVSFIKSNDGNATTAMAQLKTLGASQFDLYTGTLRLEEIWQQTVNWLHQQQYFTEAAYARACSEHGGYKVFNLSDASGWTLRYLPRPDFIHLHPSRHVPHTQRIKANTMKTACAGMLYAGWQNELPDIALLNQLRVNFLDLPPLAATADLAALQKIYGLLRQGLVNGTADLQ